MERQCHWKLHMKDVHAKSVQAAPWAEACGSRAGEVGGGKGKGATHDLGPSVLAPGVHLCTQAFCLSATVLPPLVKVVTDASHCSRKMLSFGQVVCISIATCTIYKLNSCAAQARIR